ncbi:MAG TPA: M48 family metalloprotease, partial [Thermoanaerobaculia bacterium]
RIVLRMNGAREVSPEAAPGLHRMVEELAGQAGVPKPRVYAIDAEYPNAFATGRSPKHGVVAVTEGILRLLDERELRGVLAHEISHIKNRDILVGTIAACLAAAIASIGHMFQWGALFGGSSDDEGGSAAGGLAVAILAPIAATLVQLGVSRSREYLADETGARAVGDPEPLASALRKLEAAAHDVPARIAPATASLFIVNPLAGGRVAGLFSTHPPMARRIERLLAMKYGPAQIR